MKCGNNAGVGFGDHCAFIYTAEMAPPRFVFAAQQLISITVQQVGFVAAA